MQQMSLEHKHLPICQKDRGICRIIDIYANGDAFDEEDMHRKVREAYEIINRCDEKERKMYNLNSRRRQTGIWCSHRVESFGPPSDMEELMKKQLKRQEKREQAKKKKAAGNAKMGNCSEKSGDWVSWDDLDAELANSANGNGECYGPGWDEKVKEWRQMLFGAESTKTTEGSDGSEERWKEKVKGWNETLFGGSKNNWNKDKDDCIVID